MAQTYAVKGQRRTSRNKSRKLGVELVSKGNGPAEFKLLVGKGLVTVQDALTSEVLGYSATQAKVHKFLGVLRHQRSARQAQA